MNSAPSFVADTTTIIEEGCSNEAFAVSEEPSLSKKCHVFLLQNPNDLGKKEVVPLFHLDLEPDEKIIPVLKEFSRPGTNITRIFFGGKNTMLRAKPKNGGKIMVFSLENFARKRSLPAPSPENSEAFGQLVSIGKAYQDFGAIIYLPN